MEIASWQFPGLFNEINGEVELSTGRVKTFETLRDRGIVTFVPPVTPFSGKS
jgi:hypothetical protein